MTMLRPTTIDFETFAIEDRPHSPPCPVGVSIKRWGRRSRYYAFGHLNGNTHCWSEARAALKAAYETPDGILFQNGKFDLDVAEVWFGLSLPVWDRIHDTTFLLFLNNPHEKELGLKESAHRLLEWPADEQDEVAEWLIKNQPIPNRKIGRAKGTKNYFANFIAAAPGRLVARYANGDVERTEALFELLYPSIVERGMQTAYDRERRLMPRSLEMERQGVPVDLDRLRADVALYQKWSTKIDQWLRRKLNASPTLNLNSGAALFDAMLNAGFIDKSRALLTPKSGKYQTNKKALHRAVNDNVLLAMLTYRAQLQTSLNTFMTPWLKTASLSGGFIFTTWHQVKVPKGDHTQGTRTGRFSSSPNFQNQPKQFKPLFKHEEKDPEKKAVLPCCPLGLPPLPLIRGYLCPFPGHVLIDRDYSQQEPRILAHFDGAALREKYLADPWVDYHRAVQEKLEAIGKQYDRKKIKAINLGIIYGMGIATMAEEAGLGMEETKLLKNTILGLYPGIKAMNWSMKRLAKLKLPFMTWGGREYYCEPPRIKDRRVQEFDYKMLNLRIQGSAADCTKEAVIRFYACKKPSWKLILTLHDQLTASVPRRDMHQAMAVLREAMESVDFDVPMLTEGDVSATNWGELQAYDRKGERVYA